MSITRTDIINTFIDNGQYTRYLEIGLDDPTRNFTKVHCLQKESCDPFLGCKIPTTTQKYLTYHMTSDAMFANLPSSKEWDIVFIDGLHHKEQVIRDVINSLKHLTKDGVIILHDCLPSNEKQQIVPRIQQEWVGDVWKAAAALISSGLDLSVLDTDYGVGIIKYQEVSLDPDSFDFSKYTWEEYQRNRNKLLNVVETQFIPDWVAQNSKHQITN